ncbi:hypothetical protein ACMFMG_001838 [Clarireedia jacksonii]
MCCHLGFANNGGDQCGSGSTYGLCGVTGTQLWRESCTDQTWQSPVCLKLCLGVNDTAITACPDGSYCCGKNAKDCCDAGQGKFIVNNQVADSAGDNSLNINTTSVIKSSSIIVEAKPTTGPITASITPSPSVLTTTISQSVPTTIFQSTSTGSSASQSHPLSTGTKAGIAVGTTMCLIGFLALAGFFWKRKVKKLDTVDDSRFSSEKIEVVVGGDTKSRPMYGNSVEADSVCRPAEMGNGRREPIEML